MRRIAAVLAVLFLVAGLAALPARLAPRANGNSDFTHFESPHVHPIAITPDGTRLLVVNTPDDRLSVFDLTTPAPTRIAEIPVGMEPVSVIAHGNGEAWVVNQLSDDVSIVNLATGNVRATLHVGDEPADVVFAGTPEKAYVSVSMEDVLKAYDPTNFALAPVVIAFNASRPRALARSLDGSQVLVDIFHSSAQATTIPAAQVGDSLPAPTPAMVAGLSPRPKVGIEVKKNGFGNYVDPSDHIWNVHVPFKQNLVELAYVSTTSNSESSWRGDIGTIQMGLAVNPVSGVAAVTGTYAIVESQFVPNLRGHVTEARLALVPFGAGRTEVQLNPHINYTVTPGPQSELDSSLAIPTGVAWSPDGQRVFVTALGSDKMAVVSSAGAILARVPTVAGPTGVLADPTRGRVYVVGRYHNQLQTLSAASFASVAVASIGMDPTPDAVVNGRKFFYGGFTSGHGDEACASCHLFGDADGLAWELGDPTGSMAPVPPGMTDPSLQPFHPMKGPMVTQSLRGLSGTGVQHWRGDRANLDAFNPAFHDLMGRAAVLPDTELAAFDAFVMPLTYPPNPNERLDRSMPDAPPGTPSALRGQQFFTTTPVEGSKRCIDCHSLPAGTNGQMVNAAALFEPQDMKVPQLRNLYTKSGRRDSLNYVTRRGFGYTHDGSVDNLFDFLHAPQFGFAGTPPVADGVRHDVEAFLLAFDTGLAPAVGWQITWDGTNGGNATLLARMDTLTTQADQGNCDVIAHGRVAGTPRGWLYTRGGRWKSDQASDASMSSASLRALAAASGGEITVTAVPQGDGQRMAIDRDRDGFLDADELAAGTDPGDPASHPAASGVGAPSASGFALRSIAPNPFRGGTTLAFALGHASAVDAEVVDVLGRHVRTLAHGMWLGSGPQTIVWDGRGANGTHAGAGVYFVRLRTEGGSWTRGVIKLR